MKAASLPWADPRAEHRGALMASVDRCHVVTCGLFVLVAGAACAHPAAAASPERSAERAAPRPTDTASARSPGKLEPRVSSASRARRLSLVFGGDVMLGRYVGGEFRLHGGERPLEALTPTLRRADLAVINLETPLLDVDPPWS